MNEDIVIPIAGMLFVLALVLGIPLVRSYVKRTEGQESLPSPSDERLERIEHAIDAMAIEVERIAEGQRFVTKLLADRESQPAALASRVGEQGGRTS